MIRPNLNNRRERSEQRKRPSNLAATLRCPCFAADQPMPPRFTILFRLRGSPNIPVRAFATVLLTHTLAFAPAF